MCLTVYGSRVRYKIAVEDITVYKRLEKKTNLSPYRDFKYVANKEYVSDKKLKAYGSWCKDRWSIEHGLHAYTSRHAALWRCKSHEKVVLFVIPKGTKYVIGGNDDIVAEKMVTGVLKGIR